MSVAYLHTVQSPGLTYEPVIINQAIILGAMSAAGLAGKFQPGWQLPWRGLLTAVFGGLLVSVHQNRGTAGRAWAGRSRSREPREFVIGRGTTPRGNKK